MDISTLPRQQHKKLRAMLASVEEIKLWIDDHDCLVIGIGVLKGGTGKTTSTLFFALYLAIVLGLKVAVIDTDDNSQSVDNWHKIRDEREEEVPFTLFSYDPKDEESPDLDDLVESLKDQFQVIIVDTGGAGKEAYWEMCKAAHLMLLPVAPSGYEISRINASLRQAAKGTKANPDLRVMVFMVKCSGNNTLAQEQRPVLQRIVDTQDPALVNAMLVPEEFQISGSPDYPRSWETTPRRKELQEFGQLTKFLVKELVVGKVAA
ncbi:division plane positioning ATPase MipZ [Streptomyces sp. NPDC018055]|uniref:nucleotide-binding protein n=1 Tax=Streptomyces sp. NPDC018055 TaxID=3365038 RepID=UPI00378AD074